MGGMLRHFDCLSRNHVLPLSAAPAITQPRATAQQPGRKGGKAELIRLIGSKKRTLLPYDKITRSPDHQITRSPDHQITRSPDHSITRSLLARISGRSSRLLNNPLPCKLLLCSVRKTYDFCSNTISYWLPGLLSYSLSL